MTSQRQQFPPAERLIESRHLYQGRVVNLRLDTVETPDGHRYRREVVEHGEVVAIVALDADGNVLLVRQYRGPVGEVTLEIPAGGIDPGESAEEAVQRELQEETGQRAGTVQRLCGFYASPGYCSEFIHLYLAKELSASRLRADLDEAIQVVRLPLPAALRLIDSGEIHDGKSIIGLLLARRWVTG